MIKRKGRIIIILTGLFVLLIVAEHYAPRAVDWKYTFNASDKIPYGCRVLRKDLLPALFENKILDNNNSFYESLSSIREAKNNLIVVTTAFNPDKLEVEALLKFAERGNSVFISAFTISEKLLDTLQIVMRIIPIDTGILHQSKSSLNLANPYLKKKSGYIFNRHLPEHYFAGFDTARSVILGFNENSQVDFIKTNFHEGTFYIHCQPGVFTNYHLLYSNYEYASTVLSYMPIVNTIWDEYYKPYKNIIRTPVRYILGQRSLRAAYFLIISVIFLYMLFEGKRRQRAVPVIKPLRNTTLGFIETIGRLYLQRNDHRDLALKKLLFLNEQIYSRYSVNMIEHNENLYEKLSRKSGVEFYLIKNIYTKAVDIWNKKQISAHELSGFNKMINDFNNKCY